MELLRWSCRQPHSFLSPTPHKLHTPPFYRHPLFGLAFGDSVAEFLGMIRPGKCEISFEGKSTLHPYSVRATDVTVSVIAVSPAQVTRLEVSVPVAGLHSGDSGLDETMANALKAAAHPAIIYRLDRLDSSPGAGAGTSRFRARGNLTVAGVSKTIELEAEGSLSGGKLVVRGEKPLLMSEFGIAPPKKLLGLLKADDKVTIHFTAEFDLG